MRIDNYELEVFTPPCEPGAERYSAVTHLSHSIAEVLPSLNATLTGANYMPSAIALTLSGTNCHECGEATCTAFAFGLIQGNHTLEECPALTNEQRAALEVFV